MSDRPFTYDITPPEFVPSNFDNHIVRRLSAMRGQFANRQALEAMAAESDRILYEVYEIARPEAPGELRQGVSIVHPGQVGDEYFMTKGHFHVVLNDAEVYLCLRGQGMMVMETPEGEWAVEPLEPQRILYVPPRWAHRLVNTGLGEDLVTFFVYGGDAGHDYGSIERNGFRKIVVERGGLPEIADNPRWLPSQER
jgi:glucose-6-phosphate isomerase